jgi:hypothetical protein
MSEEEYFVECSKHGKQQATYVCQHIVQGLKNNSNYSAVFVVAAISLHT